MRKTNYILLFIVFVLIFFWLLGSVKKAITQTNIAEEIIITVDKQKVQKGEEFNVAIKNKNASVAAYTIKLYFDSNIVEPSLLPENSNIVNNTLLYTWFDEQGGKSKNSNETLVKFKFKAKENGNNIFAAQGEFYNAQQEKMQVNIQQAEIKVENEIQEQVENTTIEQNTNNLTAQQSLNDNNVQQSTNKNNANLAILRLSQEGIVPTFNPKIKEYYITINEEIQNLQITAISENTNSKVVITGNENLKNGSNTVFIKVTSENEKQTQEYKIYVTKTNQQQMANTNLENLAIENTILMPDFQQQVLNYKAEVNNDVQEINILAIPQNEKATVKITGNTNLKEGDNLVEVLVNSDNNISFKKYGITVHRKTKQETQDEIEQNNVLETQEGQEEKRQEAEDVKQQNESLQNINEIDNSKEIQDAKQEEKNEETKSGLLFLWGVIVFCAIGGIGGIIYYYKKNST